MLLFYVYIDQCCHSFIAALHQNLPALRFCCFFLGDSICIAVIVIIVSLLLILILIIMIIIIITRTSSLYLYLWLLPFVRGYLETESGCCHSFVAALKLDLPALRFCRAFPPPPPPPEKAATAPRGAVAALLWLGTADPAPAAIFILAATTS